MVRKIRTGLIVLLTGYLSGCSSTFTGVINGSGEQVTFTRYSGLCLDSIMVTLPDGETFAGYLYGSKEPDARCKVGFRTGSSNAYSVLYGDRVNMMQCDFEAAKAGAAEMPGSSGLCDLSDSRTIALKDWPSD